LWTSLLISKRSELKVRLSVQLSRECPGCRPRLSLAPESFAPSAVHLPVNTFQTVRRARSLVPESFRGRLLLRRRSCERSLPRGHSGAKTPGDRAALAG